MNRIATDRVSDRVGTLGDGSREATAPLNSQILQNPGSELAKCHKQCYKYSSMLYFFGDLQISVRARTRIILVSCITLLLGEEILVCSYNKHI